MVFYFGACGDVIEMIGTPIMIKLIVMYMFINGTYIERLEGEFQNISQCEVATQSFYKRKSPVLDVIARCD